MKTFRLIAVSLACVCLCLCAAAVPGGSAVPVTTARYASQVSGSTTVAMNINSTAIEAVAVTLINGDGASPASSETAAYKGAKLPTVEVPVKEGFVFEGYYTSEEKGTQIYDKFGVGVMTYNEIPSTLTLYARWSEIIYD